MLRLLAINDDSGNLVIKDALLLEFRRLRRETREVIRGCFISDFGIDSSDSSESSSPTNGRK